MRQKRGKKSDDELFIVRTDSAMTPAMIGAPLRANVRTRTVLKL
jgi:hypothetical protein